MLSNFAKHYKSFDFKFKAEFLREFLVSLNVCKVKEINNDNAGRCSLLLKYLLKGDKNFDKEIMMLHSKRDVNVCVSVAVL